jgi:pyruvate, water dikinase
LLEFIGGKKFDFEETTKRNTSVVFAGDEKRWEIMTGEDARLFIEKYMKRNTGSTLKGRVASRGFVRGVAKVITRQTDFSKMNEGDVLVVCNTTPDYVPIMKKAAAIVAEEGGITAHVSVVSREFGIPCVVGVTNVTEILKDGDMVEVDAERGIVKKL